MMTKTTRTLAMLLLATAGAATSAQAQDVSYDLSTYLWLPTTNAAVVTRNGIAESELSGSDALDMLDFGLMMTGSARRGDWTLTGDLVYLDLSTDVDQPLGGAFSQLTTVTKLKMASAYALYTVRETPDQQIEVGAGLRAMSIDLDLSFDAGALPATDLTIADSWVDPLIAARITQNFNDKWYGSLMFDYGGFGIDNASDESWQAVATVGYRINDSWTAVGAYRHLQFDRAADGQDYQLEFSGPVIGVNYQF